MLDRAPLLFQRHGIGVMGQEDAMRIAHADADGIARQRQMQRVLRTGQRDLAPVGQRRAHVDPDPAVAQHRFQKPALGADGQPVAPGLTQDQPGDAAGRVATGTRPAAVRVPEIEGEIGLGIVVQFGQLVETHAPVPVAQPFGQRRCRHPGPATRIDDHEVVSGSVHLAEGEGFGRGCHARAYRRKPCALPVGARECGSRSTGPG